MARDKTDKTDKTPAATTATPGGASGLKWETRVIAEDDLSQVHVRSALIDNPAQAEEAAALTQGDDFCSFIRRLADECDRILESEGLPAAAQKVLQYGDGLWEPLPPHWAGLSGNEIVAEMQKMGRPAIKPGHVIARARADLSNAWYAGNIGMKCRTALHRIESGEAGTPETLALIFAIASRRTDWLWRQREKKNVLRGRKTLKAASKGGEIRRGKLAEDTAKRLAEMGQLMEAKRGGSISWAAEAAFRKGLGKSANANRALWYAHRAPKNL